MSSTRHDNAKQSVATGNQYVSRESDANLATNQSANGVIPEGNGNGDNDDDQPSFLAKSDAQAVRKQVDWYFSDENLIGDKYLLGKMRGRKNRPVDLDIIHGFKKMRQFQPFSAVAEALQISKSVDVIHEHGKIYLKRKEPYVKERVTGEKPTKKKGKAAQPTGFEEWYADAPMTAEAAAEEDDKYHPSRPVAERLETALQRYQAKRKFHAHPRNIFDKWMRLGGVNAGPKQFTGGPDQKELEGMNADEIRAMTATTFIDGEETDEDGNPAWTVDFDGVARCFLSSHLPLLWEIEEERQIKEFTIILRNFYRYILLHNVCPEYADDVKAAISTCDFADRELPLLSKLRALLPGDFNIACSLLSEGRSDRQFVPVQDWDDTNTSTNKNSEMSVLEARQIFSLCMASQLDADKMAEVNASSTQQWSAKDIGIIWLEVTDWTHPSKEAMEFYRTFKADLKPVGLMRCKHWIDPCEQPDDDLPPGVISRTSAAQQLGEVTLYMDQDILSLMFKGLKMEVSVKALDNGIHFVHHVVSCKCSFYTSLPNEIMNGFKEPRWITREEQKEREARLAGDEEAYADDEGDFEGQ